MEIKESTKNRLVAFFPEYDHSFLNVLKEELHEDSSVNVAAYNVDHPLVGKPKLIVETTKGDPKTALLGAIKRLKTKNQDFTTAFKKA